MGRNDGTGDETGDRDDLRALLRAADPGRALPPLTDTERARALEDAMDPEHHHEPTETLRTPDGYATRAAGTRHRNPLAWLVAAAAVLVIGGGTWAGVRLTDGDDPTGPTAIAPGSTAPTADPGGAGDSGAAPQDPAPRLSLPEGAGATARCMVPSAQVLRDQEVAFEGTAVEVGEETVTLEVGEWFRGGDAATVEVETVDETLQQVVVAPDFVEGRTYLVSASDGLVTLCGFSEEADDGLRVLYDRAFG